MTDLKPTPRHVLILDDDDLFLDLANAFLNAHGCRVSSFLASQAALDFVRKERVDACICDINLRGGSSGLQFYREMQKIRGAKDALFAFVTGEAISTVEIQELLADRNLKVFLKPLTFRDVVKFVLDGTSDARAKKIA